MNKTKAFATSAQKDDSNKPRHPWNCSLQELSQEALVSSRSQGNVVFSFVTR